MRIQSLWLVCLESDTWEPKLIPIRAFKSQKKANEWTAEENSKTPPKEWYTVRHLSLLTEEV